MGRNFVKSELNDPESAVISLEFPNDLPLDLTLDLPPFDQSSRP